jgi:hypothetical protein
MTKRRKSTRNLRPEFRVVARGHQNSGHGEVFHLVGGWPLML